MQTTILEDIDIRLMTQRDKVDFVLLERGSDNL